MIENTTSSYVINIYESSFNLARKRCKAHLVNLWVYKNSDVCIITLEYWDNVTMHITENILPFVCYSTQIAVFSLMYNYVERACCI